ncbi:MAG: thymidylate synthase [Candidatus Aenigmarchaeota archaeon]|nr:thymidylate synthase [Candidatus Aenigmarchaeota archaeon]MDW8149272.1 thymidylate synthase [Candidatus Aenigmarchaeota archaeon]
MNKDIIILNKNSNIAISTLWTIKEFIISKLSKRIKNKIAIIGTTYTSYGINYILETLSQFPKINKLILFGSDLSISGETLKKVFENKEITNTIILPKDKVKKIIESIELLDLRKEFEKKNFKKLENVIEKNFEEDAKEIREIINLKVEEKVKLHSWPIPLSGHYIYETSVFRAWIKALDLITKFGSIKYSEYEEPQKEYLNLMITIGLYSSYYKIEEKFFKYLDKKIFEKHINEVLSAKKESSVAYTYGERIFKHRFGKNQIEYLINKLSKTPYSRRALVISWDHEIDQNSKNPPCIIGIQGTITENYYNHTIWIRSNDMVKGWPINIVAQIKLAEYITKEINKRANTNYELGTITTISTSAHIYKHDWELVKRILSKNINVKKEFVEDPKGNFLIFLKDNKVVLEQRVPKTSQISFRIESNNFEEIYNALKGDIMFSSFNHALYLGKEIKTAFEKLKRKEKYIQDRT